MIKLLKYCILSVLFTFNFALIANQPIDLKINQFAENFWDSPSGFFAKTLRTDKYTEIQKLSKMSVNSFDSEAFKTMSVLFIESFLNQYSNEKLALLCNDLFTVMTQLEVSVLNNKSFGTCNEQYANTLVTLDLARYFHSIFRNNCVVVDPSELFRSQLEKYVVMNINNNGLTSKKNSLTLHCGDVKSFKNKLYPNAVKFIFSNLLQLKSENND